jgi:hypothetical protein
MVRKAEPFVAMFHRTLCIAKAQNKHGIILNYDDMQMGRRLSSYNNGYPENCFAVCV